MKFSRVLVLAPHTDDAELGCGGALARLIEDGAQICVAAFSIRGAMLPEGAAPDTLRIEFGDAMRTLGLPEDRIKLYDYPLRTLSEHRQAILDALLTLRKEFLPDTVLLPSGADVHQDHQVIHAEGLRAFKDITVWGYELPWNHIAFSAQAFVVLERRHVEAKLRLLQAYRSQSALGRPYFDPAFIEGLARVRGLQVKAQYAEAFEVIRARY